MLKHQKVYGTSAVEKKYVLGRKQKFTGGCLNIGRYYALDSSLGAPVFIDATKPHVILICGKRGYGKSYSLGVLLEEFAKIESEVSQNLGILIIDTLGVFWTTQYPNTEDRETLKRWHLSPQAFPFRLLIPNKHVGQYINKNISVESYTLRVSLLSAHQWCQLFNVSIVEPVGVALSRAIYGLQELKKSYSLDDIIASIHTDMQIDAMTKAAAENFLHLAKSWGVFTTEGLEASDIVKRGVITVLDLSLIPHAELKVLITSLLGQQIFVERIKERKIHELAKIGKHVKETGIPMVWMMIDEAQLFLPNDTETLSKKVFIHEWMRQGRQPGLSLVLATQRPHALDPEVVSHCDMIICHRLTAQDDIDALSRIRPSYLHGDIKESIKKIGDEKGVAFILDDTSESSHIIKIRPRQSWHGGAEPVALVLKDP